MYDFFSHNMFEFINLFSYFHDKYCEDKEDDEYELVDDYGDYVLLRNKKTGEKVLERKEE